MRFGEFRLEGRTERQWPPLAVHRLDPETPQICANHGRSSRDGELCYGVSWRRERTPVPTFSMACRIIAGVDAKRFDSDNSPTRRRGPSLRNAVIARGPFETPRTPCRGTGHEWLLHCLIITRAETLEPCPVSRGRTAGSVATTRRFCRVSCRIRPVPMEPFCPTLPDGSPRSRATDELLPRQKPAPTPMTPCFSDDRGAI